MSTAPLAPLFPSPFDPISLVFLQPGMLSPSCFLVPSFGVAGKPSPGFAASSPSYSSHERTRTVRDPEGSSLKVRPAPRAQRRRSPTSERPGSNTYAHTERTALRQPALTAAPPAGDVPSRPASNPPPLEPPAPMYAKYSLRLHRTHNLPSPVNGAQTFQCTGDVIRVLGTFERVGGVPMVGRRLHRALQPPEFSACITPEVFSNGADVG